MKILQLAYFKIENELHEKLDKQKIDFKFCVIFILFKFCVIFGELAILNYLFIKIYLIILYLS